MSVCDQTITEIRVTPQSESAVQLEMFPCNGQVWECSFSDVAQAHIHTTGELCRAHAPCSAEHESSLGHFFSFSLLFVLLSLRHVRRYRTYFFHLNHFAHHPAAGNAEERRRKRHAAAPSSFGRAGVGVGLSDRFYLQHQQCRSRETTAAAGTNVRRCLRRTS